MLLVSKAWMFLVGHESARRKRASGVRMERAKASKGVKDQMVGTSPRAL